MAAGAGENGCIRTGEYSLAPPLKTTLYLLMKRKHYYSFTFSHSGSGMTTTASVYIGYAVNFVSIPQIEGAKVKAKIHEDAVMLSCCYLGMMTKEEMETGITLHSTLNRKAWSFWSKLIDCIRFPVK